MWPGELLVAAALVGFLLMALRNHARASFLVALGLVLTLATVAALAAPEPWQLQETRYCGPPARNADGSIKRSTAVLTAFKRVHPCPNPAATGNTCPGWALNHVIPLACGGCDSVSNLDWMPAEIKSCAEPWCRDRWERKVYDAVTGIEGTDACTNTPVSWAQPAATAPSAPASSP